MYQVIHEMLEIYKGRTGSQYLKNLIQVLEKEELLNAAGNLYLTDFMT